MIIGGDKKPVVKNIEQAAKEQRFNDKVEVNDPTLTLEAERKLIADFLEQRNYLFYRLKNLLSRACINLLTKILMFHTRVVGSKQISGIKSGAIVTSNHFNPLENMAVRIAVQKAQHKRLAFVSQPTNLKMPGILGFLVSFGDVVPLSASMHYMNRDFPRLLEEHIKKGHNVLIYPEQEMWFNYKKPRPVKRGPYYYAARMNVPVISCFVEIRDLGVPDNDQFNKVRYTIHILAPIYPDPNLTVTQNSMWMMKRDYEQKKAAYEKAYGKKLSYDFELGDIVGWRE